MLKDDRTAAHELEATIVPAVTVRIEHVQHVAAWRQAHVLSVHLIAAV